MSVHLNRAVAMAMRLHSDGPMNRTTVLEAQELLRELGRLADTWQRTAEVLQSEVAGLRSGCDAAQADAAAAFGLVSRIRFALGDNGARMQGELVEWCETLAAQAKAEPIGYMSPHQTPLVRDPLDPNDAGGPYIPMRKTPMGNFTLALYTAPQPAQAQQDEALRTARGAIMELERQVFALTQQRDVLQTCLAQHQRDAEDPPGYLQDAVIKAAGLGAMAEELAALKKAQAQAQPLTIDKVRALPTIHAPEIDGEESDGTPRYWRRRPHVSLSALERLLRAHGIGQPAERSAL